MAKERNLSPQDARWAKDAVSMERRTPTEVLPVEDNDVESNIHQTSSLFLD